MSKRKWWSLFFADILICIFSVFTTYYIKYKVNNNVFWYEEFYRNCIIMIILSAGLFLLLRTHDGITEMNIMGYSARVIKAVALVSLIFFILNRLILWYDHLMPLITWRTLFINAIIVSVLLIIYRMIFKYILGLLKILDSVIKG